MSAILRGREVLGSAEAGSKARALTRAEQAGLNVPRWFAFVSPEFHERLTPVERAAIHSAVLDLCPDGTFVAVRSSAVEEDGVGHSFAGQFETFLNVAPEDVPDRIVDVWRSALSPRAAAYRRERGLGCSTRPPGVLIQRMLAPRAAGVAFSADPVSGRRGLAVVSAVRGLGSSLVSGAAEGDTWHVDRSGGIVRRSVASTSPALSDAEIRAIAEFARAAERCAGSPQDIEWALQDELFLLQSRPITTLRSLPDPDAPLTIWDNSNIVESYSGVTMPLTFSFVREIYPPVYQQFCRLMGVPERALRDHDDTFRNMLGLIRGRLYYNLLNWHRMLALISGYRVNRSFMEQMMGVKEPIPDELVEQVAGAPSRRMKDVASVAYSCARLVIHHFTIQRQVTRFTRRLDDALAPPSPPLEDQRLDELVAHYRALRRHLLLRWDAPIVNDFFTMLFYGVLRRLTTSWLGDRTGTLQNDLIGGHGGLTSAEPALRVRHLAKLASIDSPLLDLLTTAGSQEILAAIRDRPEFGDQYRAYLTKFGDRTINELKLESATLHDDPLPLFRAVAAVARESASKTTVTGGDSSSAERLRAAARALVAQKFAGRPIRRAIFAWVLRHARARLRDRENLRLERTRLFARVRRVFVEIGRRLHANGALDDARDVFYLEVEELLAFVDGRSTCTDLRSLAALRQREFRAYQDGDAPDDRFETRGAVYHAHNFRAQGSVNMSAGAQGEEYRGTGCSPGKVRGRVRIIADPVAATLGEPAILVTRHTDPGWVVLFPMALGIVVERGSLLSHAAIVARELGIPAIVSAPGITYAFRDGELVEMDGTSGVIRRLAASHADGVTRCA